MRKIIVIVLIFGVVSSLIAQDKSVSVEKSVFGIQAGFLGVWVHNETKLSNQIALRAEIGLGFDFDGFTIYETNLNRKTFGMAPVFTIEPRWYYNLDRRVSNSRTISDNSGNFFSIKTTYYPDWFIITIPKFDRAIVSPQISIIPTWGIRRNLGNHFNFETAIGFGYRHVFRESLGLSDINEGALNLHLRIGYRF